MINSKEDQTKAIRERQRTCGGELRKHSTKIYQPKIEILKTIKTHQPKIELQKKIKNQREGQHNYLLFERIREKIANLQTKI